MRKIYLIFLPHSRHLKLCSKWLINTTGSLLCFSEQTVGRVSNRSRRSWRSRSWSTQDGHVRAQRLITVRADATRLQSSFHVVAARTSSHKLVLYYRFCFNSPQLKPKFPRQTSFWLLFMELEKKLWVPGSFCIETDEMCFSKTCVKFGRCYDNQRWAEAVDK